MKKIILTNEFHDTEATVIPQIITDGRYKGYHKISRKTAQRLYNELCGVDGCMCGGTFGERGGVRLDIINEDYDRNYIVNLAGSNL